MATRMNLGSVPQLVEAHRSVNLCLIPGTMTSSFFFVLSLNNLTSSSLSNSSTKLPAAFRNDQTKLATSSALCMPLSFLPLVKLSAVDSLDAGSVPLELAEEIFEMRPEVRTMAPVSRDNIRVL
jgi:hypothetical protein